MGYDMIDNILKKLAKREKEIPQIIQEESTFEYVRGDIMDSLFLEGDTLNQTQGKFSSRMKEDSKSSDNNLFRKMKNSL